MRPKMSTKSSGCSPSTPVISNSSWVSSFDQAIPPWWIPNSNPISRKWTRTRHGGCPASKVLSANLQTRKGNKQNFKILNNWINYPQFSVKFSTFKEKYVQLDVRTWIKISTFLKILNNILNIFRATTSSPTSSLRAVGSRFANFSNSRPKFARMSRNMGRRCSGDFLRF